MQKGQQLPGLALSTTGDGPEWADFKVGRIKQEQMHSEPLLSKASKLLGPCTPLKTQLKTSQRGLAHVCSWSGRHSPPPGSSQSKRNARLENGSIDALTFPSLPFMNNNLILFVKLLLIKNTMLFITSSIHKPRTVLGTTNVTCFQPRNSCGV